MSNIKKIIASIGLIAAIAFVALSAYQTLGGQFNVASASEDCVAARDLTGTIDRTTLRGTITNHSANCTYSVGMASYKVYTDQPYSDENSLTQKLVDSKTGTVGRNTSISFTVNNPTCNRQIDLFYGDVITDFSQGHYRTRILDSIYDVSRGICTNTPPPPPSACADNTTLTLNETKTAIGTGKVRVSVAINNTTHQAEGTAINNTNCKLPVSLITYKMYDGHLSNQEFFAGTDVVYVQPNTTEVLKTNLPTCMAQSDLYYGAGPHQLYDDNRDSYRTLAWVFYQNNSGSYSSPSPAGNLCHPDTPPENPQINVSTTCVANRPQITVTWTSANQGSQGYHVDVTSNSNFNGGGWYTNIPSGTNSATFSDFTGFLPFGDAPGNLTMSSNTTYKVRIYYIDSNGHSNEVSITTNNCQPNNPTFDGTCAVSNSNPSIGQTVTWSANATGGNGNYSYSWTGDENLSSNSQSVDKSYSFSGTKTATVVISSNGQSVTRQCTTVVRQQNNPSFTGSCYANPTSAGTGATVNWYANASGGTGNYSYSWSGDDNLSGNSSNISHIYWSTGDKYAQVTISDGNQTITPNCRVNIYSGGGYNPPPSNFSATCSANPSSIYVGQSVTWSANAYNGNGYYTYAWTGTDGLQTGSYQSIQKTYTTPGQKQATVTVYSNGQTVTQTCTINVASNYIPYVPPPVSGGVYLSEVPYTGIGSSVKVGFFILALIGWSIVVSYMLIKRKAQQNGMTIGELINSSRAGNFAVANIAAFAPRSEAPVKSPFVVPAPSAPVSEPVVAQMASTIPANLPTDASFGSLYAQHKVEKPHYMKVANPEAVIAQSGHSQDVIQSLEVKARELETIVSAEGLELIAKASNNNKHNALIILTHLVELYQGTADKRFSEDGDWIVLNGEKINRILTASSTTMTPVFVQWLAEGDDRKILAFMRLVQMQGQAISTFVTNIASELDKAYQFRMENQGTADATILDLTSSWTNQELEYAIQTLVGSVDKTHTSVYSSVKIALIKILELSKAKLYA
jgi:hypothetical protein